MQESQHTGSVFSQAHTQVVFQWHRITSFHSRSQKVAYLKGLSFFSKGHENSRNKKIDDHKYHQDGAGEDQEAAQDWV